MAKKKGYPLGTFMKELGAERKCREYLANLRWADGFVCPQCGCRHACDNKGKVKWSGINQAILGIVQVEITAEPYTRVTTQDE